MSNSPPRPPQQAAFNFRLPSVKALIAIGLWALFVWWTGHGAFNGATADQGAEFARYGHNPEASAALFALNFWALVAALALPVVTTNLLHLLNRARLVIGATLLGMMLGRLIGSWFANALDILGAPGSVVFLFMPLLLAILGIVAIVIMGAVSLGLFWFAVGVPVSIFNAIFTFERELAVFRRQSSGLASYIVRFVFWLRNEALPNSPPDDSKGARFATIEEIQRLHDPDAAAAMAFGHIGKPLFLKTDKHVLIMASTRSGKGVTLIIPHLLRYRGSAFVLDPKGENAKATGRTRAALNDTVHYLDPFGISGKPQSRFNPLSRFTRDNMEAESKALAAAMFVVGEGKRDHWEAAGQQLLAALILFVFVSDDFPPVKKDLPTVRKVLLAGTRDALTAMLNIDAADGLLRDLASSFLETPEKEFGSILSTAQRQTEILDNPFMTACLAAYGAGAEVDFKAWRDGAMTVYLCLSAPKFPTFNRWLRLILTAALDEMTDTLNPPELPVCFMLDEMATLGHLPAVENAVGLAAGYGIQLVNVFQDVAQMRDLYKGRWASFIGNAGVRALFNLDDYDTAKYWSDFIGGQLVETRSTQQDLYGYTKGDNVSEAMRPLIPPDRLMLDYASGKMLVLATGAHPIETKRVSYWSDNSLETLWDDPRQPTRTPWAGPPQAPPPPRPVSPPARPSAPTPRPAAPAPSSPPPPPRPAASKPAPAAPAPPAAAPAARPAPAPVDVARAPAAPPQPASARTPITQAFPVLGAIKKWGHTVIDFIDPPPGPEPEPAAPPPQAPAEPFTRDDMLARLQSDLGESAPPPARAPTPTRAAQPDKSRLPSPISGVNAHKTKPPAEKPARLVITKAPNLMSEYFRQQREDDENER
jgi:type IV secretion system protein VirD4